MKKKILNRIIIAGVFYLMGALVGVADEGDELRQILEINSVLMDPLGANDVEGVRRVLEAGVEERGIDGDALIYASIMGYEEIVALLLEKGADPNRRDAMAFLNAVARGYLGIVELLYEAGAYHPDAPKLAFNMGRPEILSYFLRKDLVEYDLRFAMIYAALNNNKVEMLRAIFDEEDEPTGLYPVTEVLIRAAGAGYKEIVELTLELGGNVIEKITLEFPDVGGIDLNALEIASVFGNLDIVKMLLEHGADPKRHKSECLVRAARNNCVETVRVLLEAGADPTAYDWDWLISEVRERGYQVIEELLHDWRRKRNPFYDTPIVGGFLEWWAHG